MDETKKTVTEEFKVTGTALVDEVKRLLHEGNVTHIVVKNDEGKTVFEIPMTAGIVGLALLPILAGIAAIAVLCTHHTLVVTRTEP